MSEWPHIKFLNTVQDAFQLGADYLAKKLESDEPTLVLLSGGSAIKTYGPIVEAVKSGRKGLTVGMVDERFGEVNHKDSNGRAIAEAWDLWNLCHKNGVACRPILTGESFKKTAESYNSWLHDALNRVERSICVLGIGADGHTAGILPMPRLEFDNIFHTDKLVVGYEAPGQYRQRITVTPALLRRITSAVMVGKGPNKVAAFQRALESQDEFSLYEVPASIIHQMADVHVFANAGPV